MSDPFARLPDDAREALREEDVPQWTEPMLATLTDERFSDDGWIFERKLDGERCLAFRDGRRVRLLSRNRKDLGDTYPEIGEAVAGQQAGRFVLDGEIVAFEGRVTSFARLQQRMQVDDPDEARSSGVAVYYYVFDLLHLDGRDTSRVPLRHRKGMLRAALGFDDPLRYTPHRNGAGEAAYRQACAKGWEGLIAKDAGAAYAHSRSRAWLKFKCVHEQELVVAGFTDPKGSRVGFGALLVGFYEGGDLRYAGKVGTGYDDDTLRSLRQRMDGLERDEPAFADEHLPRKGVHWIEPELVGQFGFTEITAERRLRHPRFLGLRRDKDPESVRLERPES